MGVLMFLLSIPVANWLTSHVGACGLDAPCLVPGTTIPTGTLIAGVPLVARDAVHARYGWPGVVVTIAAGTALTVLVAPSLALASGLAFLVAEGADSVVYASTPPAWRRTASGVVGGAVDTAVFQWVAFGALAWWVGQWGVKVAWSVAADLWPTRLSWRWRYGHWRRWRLAWFRQGTGYGRTPFRFWAVGPLELRRVNDDEV